VARGYAKAIARAERIVSVEDQYFWGHGVAEPFEEALRAHPDLRLVVVIPLVPDISGLNRVPQYLGRERALVRLMRIGPGRVAAYGIENHAGTPVYVHAKVCVIDDAWASTGSDNFNRRSWTHDSELTAVVLDHDYARDLRLTLAAEHLDRLPDVAERGLHEVMADCLDPAGMYDAYASSATALEAWHHGGRAGERPRGRLRPIPLPPLSRFTRTWARLPLDVVHDPDGRPAPIRSSVEY
jgi:phosphatidylserine/phosphatidylglycerophosphate/cardiolipin synthase-like enzyme